MVAYVYSRTHGCRLNLWLDTGALFASNIHSGGGPYGHQTHPSCSAQLHVHPYREHSILIPERPRRIAPPARQPVIGQQHHIGRHLRQCGVARGFVRLLGMTQVLSDPAPIARYPWYTLIDPSHLPSYGQASLDLATLSASVPRLSAECILQDYRGEYHSARLVQLL